MQRIASHLQVFALSKWLAVTLPVEYYELARGLQWSIPYFNLPWERVNIHSLMVGSNSPKDRLFRISEVHDSIFLKGLQPEAANPDSASRVFGLPLTPLEYRSYFEVSHIITSTKKNSAIYFPSYFNRCNFQMQSQTILPEADYILDPQNSHGYFF